MDEFIEMQYTQTPGAISQAEFLAQQWFNNNGMSWKKVLYATFEDGGISCSWECAHPEKKPPADNFTPEEAEAFRVEVVETIGPDVQGAGEIIGSETVEQMEERLPHVPPMDSLSDESEDDESVPVEDDQKFICENCGKSYDSEQWYKKHIAHCK